MNIQGLIERYEKFKASKKKLTSVDLVLKDLRSLDEPEPLPFKLKDVVRRIRGFDPTTQTRWLNDILKELGDDYGSMKYRSGYEQGKLEGAWVGNQLKDADKVRQELNIPVIPQFLAEYIEFKKKNDFHVYGAMRVIEDHYDKRVPEWFYEDNIEKFCLAWIFGYEVEEEKRYLVKIRATKHYIAKDGTGKIFFSLAYKESFTKKQLEEAGFGWVFDCPGIEIEEVEN